MTRLSQQQRRFAELILEGKNQTDAYKQAGYKCANDNVAAVSASELVRNPKVVAFMAEQRQEAAKALHIDLQWLIAKGVAILEAAESGSLRACNQRPEGSRHSDRRTDREIAAGEHQPQC